VGQVLIYVTGDMTNRAQIDKFRHLRAAYYGTSSIPIMPVIG